MARDQEIVKWLQQRFPYWKPDNACGTHSHYKIFRTPVCTCNELGQIIRLHLCNLNLTQIPEEVWLCSSLRGLYLSNNSRLRTLPAKIGDLSSLEELDLSYNSFSSLPAEIGNLSSLLKLELYTAGLSALPVEMGNLSSLRQLSLLSNGLSSLPVEIGNLSSLQELNLSHNMLRTLPVEMGNLSSLLKLDLSHNPLLQSPPPDILKQGTSAILLYLRDQMRPITIFYCYAHEDKDLRDRIDKHLGVLKRLGQVVGWYDREIQAGTEWEQEIEKHLSTASIILLLVSADFVNSDYCYGVEMQKALKMHEKGEARVLPILLRPVDWQDAPFAKLQILPTGAKPITKWSDPEEALEDVAKQIRKVVTTLRTGRS